MPFVYDDENNRLLLGIHVGIVVDRNDDSAKSETPKRGRIKVKLPYLNKDADHVWMCDTCMPSHQFFSVPAVGSLVVVAFLSGHKELPVYLGSINTLLATKDPASRFSREIPDNSGYESLGGHFWEFDDLQDQRHIRIEDSAGNYHLYDSELNDLEVLFQNDERRTIGRDRTTDIGRDDKIDIGRDNLIDIVRDQTENIGGKRTTEVVDDDTLTVTEGDRSITVEQGDQSETIEQGDKTTDVETGSWKNTVKKEYELTGEDRAKFEFTDKIEVMTDDNLEFTVQGDWTADVQGNTEFTITGDWESTVTGDMKADVTGDIEFMTVQKFTAKNTLFEFNMDTSTSEWKSGATSITMTPASISIVVGGASWTMTAAGVIVSAAQYKIAGIDVITHKHLTFGAPPYTSTWVAGP